MEHDTAFLFEHMSLVVALTEANSRHLRAESRRAGAEIELAGALAGSNGDGTSPNSAARIEQLRERLSEAESALRAIESDRERLGNALSCLDSRASRTTQRGSQ